MVKPREGDVFRGAAVVEVKVEAEGLGDIEVSVLPKNQINKMQSVLLHGIRVCKVAA